MSSPSILNDVLGPVMRGPSSSHTAGSYHIGKTVRALLGEKPSGARFSFDPGGSYSRTYREQGVDLALAAGLMGWPIGDERFSRALSLSRKEGIRLNFRVTPLDRPDHPNTVDILLLGRRGNKFEATAQSTGGGTFLITRIDGWPVHLDGKAFDLLLSGTGRLKRRLAELGERLPEQLVKTPPLRRDDETLHVFHLSEAPAASLLKKLASLPETLWLRTSPPVYAVPKGKPLFVSAAEMILRAEKEKRTLGQTALAYEACLLEIPEKRVFEEILRRYRVMKSSVRLGLSGRSVRMQLLRPSARKIWNAESAGAVAVGGMHTRAAARALAAMHVSNSMGLVCAAPTGGSAGVIPGVLVTMEEEWELSPDALCRSLLAAGAIGLILAERATFAAEIAGCQVEIGAAGAMGAAAVVEAAGGTPRQAADAAAISFQNTMGSVCDLVQGMCEIPCHTRNAVAASNAFLCADLILGGYDNPIPLDETIDAVYDSGRMLPAELRVTSRGGLALAPSAVRLPNLRKRRTR